MRTLIYNGHTIQVSLGLKDKVLYDGKEVSSKITWSGGSHVFAVNENGENVQYEIDFGRKGLTGSWVTIRRNGQLVFSDK